MKHTLFHTTLSIILLCCMICLPACTSSPSSPSPYAPLTESSRDPEASLRLSQQAADLMISDPKRAESLLLDALKADLYNGQAHNNLGVLYLTQGKLYEAAGEFEWAKKLLPGHPDPRLNLALTLEHAGRTDEAIATYATALEVYPEHIPTIQALARIELHSGKHNDRTLSMLHEIALRGETENWRTWAKQQQLRLNQ